MLQDGRGIIVGSCYSCHLCGETNEQLDKYCTLNAREEDRVCWCVCPGCRDKFMQNTPYVVNKEE